MASNPNRAKEFFNKFIEIAQATDEEKADPAALIALHKEYGYSIDAMDTAILIQWIMSEYTAPRIREEVLMKIYDKRFPFDKELKPYMSLDVKALKQKGTTCASDAIFTILFEADAFRPYFFKPDWKPETVMGPHDPEKCILLPSLAENLKLNIPGYEAPAAHNASRRKYTDVLYAAKNRFTRMKSIKNTLFEVPRSSSFSDNLWAQAHKPLTKGEGGLFAIDEAHFLGNLLVRNILEIPGLPAFSVRYVQRYKPMPPSITKDNLVAFTLGLVKLGRPDPTEEDMIPFEHAVGFFKRNGKWTLIDNEVGYLHEFQDQDWFETIFLKRLFYTNEHPDKASGGNPSEKVYIQFNDDLLPYVLLMHFITLGARSYPNVAFNSDHLPFEDSELNFKINGILAITSERGPASTTPAVAGTTGGGSAIAAAVGGARRHRRKQTQRTNRSKKQTHRRKN